MNLKATLILLVVFALALAAYLLTRGSTSSTTGTGNTTDNNTQASGPILSTSDLGPALSRITFVLGEDGVRLELARIDGRWRVTKPHDFPADTQAVDELLTLLGNLRGFKSSQPLSPFPDQSSLALSIDNKVIELRLAKRQGSGRAGLTLVNGSDESHFDADDTLHDLIDQFDQTAFFARKIDTPLITAIGRITFTAEGGESLLIQDAGQWWIGQGADRQRAWDRGIAGQPGVNDYFHLLNTLAVYEHQPYDKSAGLAQFGLERPLIRVRLAPLDVSPDQLDTITEIRVGVPADPTDQLRYVSYAKASAPSPAVFTIPTAYALALGQPATSFRDPRITATARTLIQSLTLSAPNQPERVISFKQDGSGLYAVGDEAPIALDRATCSTFLDRLTAPQALGYFTEPADQLSLILRVRLDKRLGQAAEQFAIYQDPATTAEKPTVLVRREAEPVALRIDRSVIEPMLNPNLLAQ